MSGGFNPLGPQADVDALMARIMAQYDDEHPEPARVPGRGQRPSVKAVPPEIQKRWARIWNTEAVRRHRAAKGGRDV